MRIFRTLMIILAAIPLLGSCSLFQSNEKVIEYDEEVKLHDGSMIWVHIKRHYVLVGGALGDSGAFKKGYAPKEVEISWDTGFPNVGRKSVLFEEQIWTIENLNNVWYVYGGSDNTMSLLPKNITTCNSVGTRFFNGDTCLVRLDSTGKFIQSDNDTLHQLTTVNILYSSGFNSVEFLDGKHLTWQSKLDMQTGKLEKEQTINRKLFSN